MLVLINFQKQLAWVIFIIGLKKKKCQTFIIIFAENFRAILLIAIFFFDVSTNSTK